MKRKNVRHLLLQATDGLIGTVINLVLSECYFLLFLPGSTSPIKIQRASDDANKLVEELGYDTIKRAVNTLVRQGLMKRITKKGRTELAITASGRRRLEATIPTYRTDRPWDGHVYLISYDIPNDANKDRNMLREHIRKTGGALLQESLWINPYNPTNLLSEFSTAHGITGSILVSKLGKDGAIGEETLPDLLYRIYHLEELWNRYDEFLKHYSKNDPIDTFRATIDYLAILKDDPQLPFALEPEGFPAKQAFQVFQKLTRQKL